MNTYVIYARISEDRDGTSVAPERQIAICTERVLNDGGAVTGIYEDRDLSASDPTVYRPGFEEMLKHCATTGAAVIAYSGERLVRQPRDAERMMEQGLDVDTVNGGFRLRGDPDSRFQLRMTAALGARETDMIKMRLRDKYAQDAELGLPHSGGARPFGHAADRRAAHPSEAPIVREIARRILDGEGKASIVRDLRERGICTSTGGAWTLSALSHLLAAPRLCGARQLPSGELRITGAITPLISESEWRGLQAITSVKRGASAPRPGGRRYLLSGLLICGKCGTKLVSQGPTRFRCPAPSSTTSKTGCGGVLITREPLEAYVTERVLDHLSDGAPLLRPAAERERGESHESAATAAVATLTACDARAAELEEMFDARELTREQFARMNARNEARRADAQRELATLAESHETGVELPYGKDARGVWEAGSLSYRRAVIATACGPITIDPTARRGKGLDASRVRFGGAS